MTKVMKPKKKQRQQRPPEVPAQFMIVEAEAENDFRLIEATDEQGEGRSLRRFTMTAYTGGRLSLPNFPYPVVVDLSGLKIPAKSRPILRDHNAQQIVGHTDTIENSGGSIKLAGVISAANDWAREVTESSDNGFPWQASIGAAAQRMVFVDRGETVQVNGRKLTGPLYVARQAALREVSFVALGADDQTSARMAARMGAQQHDSQTIEVSNMEFEEWLEAMGFNADELDERQTTGLQAVFSREREPEPSQESRDESQGGRESRDESQEPRQTAVAAQQVPNLAALDSRHSTLDSAQPPLDPVDELRAKWAAERRRIARISDICAGEHPNIEARAIEEGWNPTKTELAVLRATRPQVPAIHASSNPCDLRVLEAAASLSAGLDENRLLTEFGEQILAAADPLRHIGLKELVAECARMEGLSIPRVFGDGQVTIRAGFSTVSLPGILENVMNKTLLAAYQETSIAAFQLCAVGSVSDFKEVSRYRLLGTGGFEKVAPTGELKAGRLDEQKYKNKADTYGQILLLTRQDILNDDLDAFLEIPRQMGRSGAELIDELFFTLLLYNPASFFSAENGNYLDGGATAFDADALTNAKTLFRKQKAGPGDAAKDQKPINVRPRSLVVPVELETEAELLMGSAQLMIDASGTPTKIPVDNPHRNKYQVISLPHLSDSYYAGSSAKAWYLFADPRVLPAFELVFLNGRRTPVIERIEAPPNVLGMGFRSYLDVGVREQDYRGATKMKGEV